MVYIVLVQITPWTGLLLKCCTKHPAKWACKNNLSRQAVWLPLAAAAVVAQGGCSGEEVVANTQAEHQGCAAALSGSKHLIRRNHQEMNTHHQPHLPVVFNQTRKSIRMLLHRATFSRYCIEKYFHWWKFSGLGWKINIHGDRSSCLTPQTINSNYACVHVLCWNLAFLIKSQACNKQ